MLVTDVTNPSSRVTRSFLGRVGNQGFFWEGMIGLRVEKISILILFFFLNISLIMIKTLQALLITVLLS